MHGEFLRLLRVFLQAHRETTVHFTAIGMPAQQHCDSFRFRRAAFYNGLKSKVVLAAAKTAEMRINLNIDGCGVVAVHSFLRAPLLLANLLAHNLLCIGYRGFAQRSPLSAHSHHELRRACKFVRRYHSIIHSTENF